MMHASQWIVSYDSRTREMLPFSHALDTLLAELDFPITAREWCAPYETMNSSGYYEVES